MLTRAGERDVDALISLLEGAAQWMSDRAINQWRPGSFRAQRPLLVSAAVKGDVLVEMVDGRVIGGALLRAEPDPIWVDRPERSALYLSKLVVARDCVGRGLGERIVLDCERFAAERNVDWLRLDCVASNDSLVRYYQRIGYYPRGVVNGLLRHDKRIAPLSGVAVPALGAVDFTHWRAASTATLTFVLRHRGRADHGVPDRDVLLIRKLRGHGAGKINAPGGMVEVGETVRRCALREIEEEVGVATPDAEPVVELLFQNTDGSRLHGFAFRATAHRGVLRQTAEADPFWCPVERIPYDEMWDDDRIWLPYLLADEPVTGAFLIDGERLVAHRLWQTSRTELARRVDQHAD